MVLFKVLAVYYNKRSLCSVHTQVHIVVNIHVAKFIPKLTDPVCLLLSCPYSHFVIFQPAEVFEFEGNVYSHHLSPIARKHSLIAGTCVGMQPQFLLMSVIQWKLLEYLLASVRAKKHWTQDKNLISYHVCQVLSPGSVLYFSPQHTADTAPSSCPSFYARL